eukprot:348289_1
MQYVKVIIVVDDNNILIPTQQCQSITIATTAGPAQMHTAPFCPVGWVFCSPAPCPVSTCHVRNAICHNNYCGHQGNGADDVSVGNCADVQKKVQVVVDMDMKVNVGVNMNKDYNGKMIFGNDGMDMDMNKVNVVRKME